jgi:hypothetical protein
MLCWRGGCLDLVDAHVAALAVEEQAAIEDQRIGPEFGLDVLEPGRAALSGSGPPA